MTTFTTTQVAHIAKLARLTLTQADAEKMATELSAILQYIDVLNEVDTSTVPPTAQVSGLCNALREDHAISSEAAPDALLACSPFPIVDHQIHVPHAHG